MAPSDFLLAFLICTSILPHAFLICTSILPQASSMALNSPGCQTKCGDIEIPYPFGMNDEGCYLDDPFRVLCSEETGSVSLPSLDWEVDSISISNHTFRHKNQSVVVMLFDQAGKAFPRPTFGNYYSISHTRNTFVAVGCEFFVYLRDEVTEKVQGSCSSLCNRNDTIPSQQLSSCSGLNCCQFSFPTDLRNLSVRMQTMNSWTIGANHQCGFFTFVDNDFLLVNKMSFSSCTENYFVPVVHHWAVGNTYCNEAQERQDYLCGPNTDCIDYTAGVGRYICKCSHGYSGNPYLAQGCQDIDECANSKDNNCPSESRCVNTQGSYFCLPNRKRMLALSIPLGTGLAVGILILAALGIWIWYKLKERKERRMKHKFFKKNGGLLLQRQISSSNGSALVELTLFKIEELEKATDKFSKSRVLGKGGLGIVYKGMLSDGRIVAVKKANILDDDQIGQFINEVVILSQINHRHIVKLFGCCLETQVPLLVYEYISNGTLSQHLHDEPKESIISWEDRLRIASEIAGALAYLHSYASTAIFHRDVKSSNVLLDEKYKAVLSDFGLSRSVSIDKTHLTTLVGGTFGYLDPLYFRSGKLNDKSDVYAFGVVLTEILTGQKAVSSNISEEGLALRFRSAMKANCLFEILEKVVEYEGQMEKILAVAKLAKRCLKLKAQKRPSMKEVAAELDQLRKNKYLSGHQENFYIGPSLTNETCYSSDIYSEAEDDQSMLLTKFASSKGNI